MRSVLQGTFKVKLKNWIIGLFRLALLALGLWGCSQKPPIPVSTQIQGEWMSLGRKIEYFRFSGDSVEFADGLFCRGDSSEIARIAGYSEYQGHFAPFRIKKDSILYREPCFGEWRLLGKIGFLRNDSLVLKMPVPQPWDSTLIKEEVFIRQKPAPRTDRKFDKIVFTEISWNYSALTTEISVAENGEVFFAGVTWHQLPDLYFGKLDTGYVNYLFNKYQEANFPNVPDKMDDGIIDGSSTYTSLMKGGKIIKSVKHRHGYDVGFYPGIDLQQLRFQINAFQAYKVAKNLPAKLEKEQKLKPHPSALPVTTLDKLLFFDGTNFMELSPPEGFFFWTELQKAKPVETPLKPVYRLFCWERFYYPEKQKGRHPAPPLYELATDGRFYKFPDKNGKPQVFDLGYNFLDRNNLNSRFKLADSCDLAKIQDREKGILY